MRQESHGSGGSRERRAEQVHAPVIAMSKSGSGKTVPWHTGPRFSPTCGSPEASLAHSGRRQDSASDQLGEA